MPLACVGVCGGGCVCVCVCVRACGGGVGTRPDKR